jgi:hypothetical protein
LLRHFSFVLRLRFLTGLGTAENRQCNNYHQKIHYLFHSSSNANFLKFIFSHNLFKASSFVDYAQEKGLVELHPAEIAELKEALPVPKAEKTLSGFGSPHDGQFKFSLDAPTD